MTKPIHVTDAEFEEKVLKSATPVVVDFWAPWCGPCQMVAPVLDELAKEYGDQLVIAKVNTDENVQYAIQYGVQGIPTMLFVKDGQLFDRVVGAMPKPAIQQRIEAMLEVVPN
ncbi:MAG: thioredoxin [Anaerolineae bacterium]|nr:thioredoxin [Anaerolineae bacterium]